MSVLVPMIYNLPYKKKEKFFFLILPSFNNEINFKASIDGTIHVSIYNLILLLIIIMRDKKKIKD